MFQYIQAIQLVKLLLSFFHVRAFALTMFSIPLIMESRELETCLKHLQPNAVDSGGKGEGSNLVTKGLRRMVNSSQTQLTIQTLGIPVILVPKHHLLPNTFTKAALREQMVICFPFSPT